MIRILTTRKDSPSTFPSTRRKHSGAKAKTQRSEHPSRAAFATLSPPTLLATPTPGGRLAPAFPAPDVPSDTGKEAAEDGATAMERMGTPQQATVDGDSGVRSKRSILLKHSDGRFETLSPEAFRRLFGVQYLQRLDVPEDIPDWVRHPPHIQRSVLRSQQIPFDYRSDTLEERLAQPNFLALLGPLDLDRLYGEKLEQGYRAKTYIQKTDERVGYGLYSGEQLEPGDFILEYTGRVRATPASDTSRYLMDYNWNPFYSIDAERHGNEARFINDGGTNANVAFVPVIHQGEYRVAILTQKPIQRDDQILANYDINWRESGIARVDLKP